MRSLTKKLLSKVPYEKVEGEVHIPRYTKGCWGKPTAKLCLLCKIRMPIKLFRLVGRLKANSKNSDTESDS